MKKSLVSFLLLFLIGGVLLYNYFMNRYNTTWEIIKEQPLLVQKDPSYSNELASYKNTTPYTAAPREFLFLNDIYKNYENFYSREEYFTNKYSIDLSTIAVLKGSVKKDKDKLEARGKEVTLGIRGTGVLFRKEKVDNLRMIIETDKDLEIKVFEVFKEISPWKKYSDIDPGFLIHRLSKFSFMAEVPGKAGKQKIDIELSNYFVKGRNRTNGLILQIKSRQGKNFKLKIAEISLKRYNNKIDESFPAAGYFKHGKTWLKSLFIPVNSTISYLVKAEKTFCLSGYLGAFPGETLDYDIKADGKSIISKQVSPGLTYFQHEITPLPQKRGSLFQITVSSKDKKNGTAVLGNFTFFYKKKEGENKNFVFYLVDALRSDYGGAAQAKKLFESYFKDGAVFKNAYANAAWTADSLPVIFSGKYKFSLVDDQVFHPNLIDEEFLLAEYLKTKGYTTAAFITNSFLVKNNSYQGFDNVYLCWQGKRYLSMFPAYSEYMDYKYGEMEKFTREFISQNKDKKLFVYIHTLEPHDPYELPIEMRHYSKGIDSELLKSVYGKFKIFLKNPTPEQVDTLKSLYKDEVLSAYNFFEKTTTFLEQEGVLGNNSLYLLTADHGERFFEHGSWVHGRPDVYQEVLRIPFMMRGSGIKPGFYFENVQLADIFPTVMDWLGDQKGKEMVGDFLLKYVNGAADHFNNRVIYCDGTKQPFLYSCIIGKIKIIIDGDKNRVYDLEKDPGETKNLAGEERFSGMIRQARRFRDKFKKGPGKKKSTLSAEELDRLKSLGYLD